MNFWVSATIYHWLQLWSNSDTTEYFLALHPVFSQNGKMFAPKWIIFFLVNSCHDQLKISCFVPDITLGGLYPFLGVLSLFVHTNDCVGGVGGGCMWVGCVGVLHCVRFDHVRKASIGKTTSAAIEKELGEVAEAVAEKPNPEKLLDAIQTFSHCFACRQWPE